MNAMNAHPWLGEVDSPLDALFHLVGEHVSNLVIEWPACCPDGSCFLLRLEGSPEAVELECQPAGHPPFIVTDEYSSVEADDPVTAAEAVLSLLHGVT